MDEPRGWARARSLQAAGSAHLEEIEDPRPNAAPGRRAVAATLLLPPELGGTATPVAAEAKTTRLARAALWALAAVLPFELEKPVAHLGALKLSSVEVFLYLALGTWLISLVHAWARAGRGARLAVVLPTPVHRAAAALGVVTLASAALAPLLSPAAIKFALRSLSGLALLWAAADLLAAPRAAVRAMTAVAVAAIVVAIMMIAELHIPSALAWLEPFHPQTFQTFGLPRASGPLQYPNIAAMFLEAGLPLLLMAGAGGSRRGPARVVLTALGGAILVEGILLSSSRAGITTALVTLLGMAVVARGRTSLRLATAATLVLSLGAVALNFFATDPLLALRLQVWHARPWYRAATVPAHLPSRIRAESWGHVRVALRNDGMIAWPWMGNHPVYVSYHFTDADSGEMVIFEGARTELPHDVAPGQSVVVTATVPAPKVPGRYVMRWDLVQEGITWFSLYGDPGATQAVEVVADRKGSATDVTPEPAQWAGDGAADEAAAGGFAGMPAQAYVPESQQLAASDAGGVPRKLLWTAALNAWDDHPLLGLGPDNFRHAYDRYVDLGGAELDDRMHANNFYLEILATLGTAGLLAFGAIAWTLARAARGAWRARDRGDLERDLVLATVAALGAYLIHGTLDYFLEFTPTYALMWLLAGMLVALSRANVQQNRAAAPARWRRARSP